MHIELYDLAACHGSGIFDVHLHSKRFVVDADAFGHAQIRQRKAGIAQAVSEWVQWPNVPRVIPAVADIDPFSVPDFLVFAAVVLVARAVIIMAGPCQRKMAGRIDKPKQNIRCDLSAHHTCKERADDRADTRFIRRKIDRSGRVHDQDELAASRFRFF